MQQCTNAATVWQIQMQLADTASAMQTRSAQPGNRATVDCDDIAMQGIGCILHGEMATPCA
eukprot:9371709-Alexandrium_andersonii.AAC.1